MPYSEGALSQGTADRVERHLRSCARCSADLAAITVTAQALRRTDIPATEPAADLWARVRGEIERQPARRPVWQVRSLQAASAAVVGSLLILFVATRSPYAPIEQSQAPERVRSEHGLITKASVTPTAAPKATLANRREAPPQRPPLAKAPVASWIAKQTPVAAVPPAMTSPGGIRPAAGNGPASLEPIAAPQPAASSSPLAENYKNAVKRYRMASAEPAPSAETLNLKDGHVVPPGKSIGQPSDGTKMSDSPGAMTKWADADRISPDDKVSKPAEAKPPAASGVGTTTKFSVSAQLYGQMNQFSAPTVPSSPNGKLLPSDAPSVGAKGEGSFDAFLQSSGDLRDSGAVQGSAATKPASAYYFANPAAPAISCWTYGYSAVPTPPVVGRLTDVKYKRDTAALRKQCNDKLAKSPNDVAAMTRLAQIEEELGDKKAAIKWRKKLTELQPAEAARWADLGRAYEANAQWADAINAYNKAISLGLKGNREAEVNARLKKLVKPGK